MSLINVSYLSVHFFFTAAFRRYSLHSSRKCIEAPRTRRDLGSKHAKVTSRLHRLWVLDSEAFKTSFDVVQYCCCRNTWRRFVLTCNKAHGSPSPWQYIHNPPGSSTHKVSSRWAVRVGASSTGPLYVPPC